MSNETLFCSVGLANFNRNPSFVGQPQPDNASIRQIKEDIDAARSMTENRVHTGDVADEDCFLCIVDIISYFVYSVKLNLSSDAILFKGPILVYISELDVSLTCTPKKTQWTLVNFVDKMKSCRIKFMPSRKCAPYKDHALKIEVVQSLHIPQELSIRTVVCTCSITNLPDFVLSCQFIVEKVNPEVLIIMDPGAPEQYYNHFFVSLGPWF
ncbi:hypothetical protein BUALT_Bualt08G0026200 [Buddleja alternifolia]|uniref:Uncharacterized protein n=1 Tax=Buddleja alternifolia TaxID=168488 RepID=A0AAV6XBM5_9LAMI|nr:hypothetical protein BUALT_Bualt08G0026200 [Buddleja alternifolia]